MKNKKGPTTRNKINFMLLMAKKKQKGWGIKKSQATRKILPNLHSKSNTVKITKKKRLKSSQIGC